MFKEMPPLFTICVGAGKRFYVMPLGFKPNDKKAEVARRIAEQNGVIEVGTYRQGTRGMIQCCFVFNLPQSEKLFEVPLRLKSLNIKTNPWVRHFIDEMENTDWIPALFHQVWNQLETALHNQNLQ